MVDEDEAKAVDMEMVDVVMVMVIEVIMKLTVVIEMMLNKEFDVEVDKEVAFLQYTLTISTSGLFQNEKTFARNLHLTALSPV